MSVKSTAGARDGGHVIGGEAPKTSAGGFTQRLAPSNVDETEGFSPTAVTDAVNDKATATTFTNAAIDNDDEVASGKRRCPTTAMTIADAANVNDDKRPTSTTTMPVSTTTSAQAAADGVGIRGHDRCRRGKHRRR
jgi:hypothetical protein